LQASVRKGFDISRTIPDNGGSTPLKIRKGVGMKRSYLTMMCGLGLLVSLVFLGGCHSPVSAKGVRNNPSPELQSIAMTKGQRKNRHARTHDTTMRQIHDHLDMILLFDRPVRLSEYPIP
jgi:hypothetical protein